MEKTVDNGQVKIACESFGNDANPAVLLLAGATVSMLYWENEFCDQLADKGFFVIRYDHRDTGQSTNYGSGKANYTIVDFAADAIAVLDGYGLKKAVFFGMSLGGLIAQVAALKFPNRVASMVLLATGPWGDASPGLPQMDERILAFQAGADRLNWENKDEVVAFVVGGYELMAGEKPFDRNRIEKYVAAEFNRAIDYKAMYNHGSLAGGEAFWNQLEEIKVPVLIIHGTADRVWNFAHATHMQKQFAAAQLITLQGTGHELHPMDYQKIVDSVAAFTTTVSMPLNANGVYAIEDDADTLEPFVDDNEHRQIDAANPDDLAYWAEQFQIGVDELKAAIVLNGNSVKAVKKYLSI